MGRSAAVGNDNWNRSGGSWSVRVGSRYRALAVEDNQNLVWFWIGSHADYDTIV
jgi:hypothetical protein